MLFMAVTMVVAFVPAITQGEDCNDTPPKRPQWPFLANSQIGVDVY